MQRVSVVVVEKYKYEKAGCNTVISSSRLATA